MNPTPELLEYLERFLTPERKALFKKVLAMRTNYFTVAIQDVYQLHNTSAVIRSCDVFGINTIHVVEERNRKKIDREIAMGSQKWVNMNRYQSTAECLERLKSQNYRIVATTPHKGIALQDFDMSTPAALFFGTEKCGLSQEVLKKADDFLQIPMVGFTQSLNISVSAAIILQHLCFQLRDSSINWRLSEAEQLATNIQWAKNNIKRVEEILKRYQESL